MQPLHINVVAGSKHVLLAVCELRDHHLAHLRVGTRHAEPEIGVYLRHLPSQRQSVRTLNEQLVHLVLLDLVDHRAAHILLMRRLSQIAAFGRKHEHGQIGKVDLVQALRALEHFVHVVVLHATQLDSAVPQIERRIQLVQRLLDLLFGAVRWNANRALDRNTACRIAENQRERSIDQPPSFLSLPTSSRFWEAAAAER